MTQVKTKVIELPTFEQLTPSEQVKVVDNYRDINTDGVRHENIKDEAEMLGFEIRTFDIDNGRIDLRFTQDLLGIADSIIAEHGEACPTYIASKNFKDALDALPVNEVGEVINENSLESIKEDFEAELGHAYLKLLRSEYEYQSSDEVVEETLRCNEYTFNRETLKIDS